MKMLLVKMPYRMIICFILQYTLQKILITQTVNHKDCKSIIAFTKYAIAFAYNEH